MLRTQPFRFVVRHLVILASVIWNPLRFADRRVAAGASREDPGERDDEVSAQGCNRVWDMSFGSDRRRLWVGSPWGRPDPDQSAAEVGPEGGRAPRSAIKKP
jgi:hypothetical protein